MTCIKSMSLYYKPYQAIFPSLSFYSSFYPFPNLRQKCARSIRPSGVLRVLRATLDLPDLKTADFSRCSL